MAQPIPERGAAYQPHRRVGGIATSTSREVQQRPASAATSLEHSHATPSCSTTPVCTLNATTTTSERPGSCVSRKHQSMRTLKLITTTSTSGVLNESNLLPGIDGGGGVRVRIIDLEAMDHVDGGSSGGGSSGSFGSFGIQSALDTTAEVLESSTAGAIDSTVRGVSGAVGATVGSLTVGSWMTSSANRALVQRFAREVCKDQRSVEIRTS